jgi:hypothetical protein
VQFPPVAPVVDEDLAETVAATARGGLAGYRWGLSTLVPLQGMGQAGRFSWNQVCDILFKVQAFGRSQGAALGPHLCRNKTQAELGHHVVSHYSLSIA